MRLFMILRFFFHFDKIMSYAVILYFSGKNFRCFLLIVVPVTGVCLLLSYGLSSIIGYIGLVGISWRAGSCTYRRLCVSTAWSAGPVRVYLVALLGWVAGRYRFPVLFGFVLACVRVIEQVGGWRVGTIFLYFCLLWRVGTIEIVSGCCILIFTSFSLLLIALAGGHGR